jgi:hypothetical protein
MQAAGQRTTAVEAAAVYRFNLLATTASGMSQDGLQTLLLQRVVGLKLPGLPRLVVLALGKPTLLA